MLETGQTPLEVQSEWTRTMGGNEAMARKMDKNTGV